MDKTRELLEQHRDALKAKKEQIEKALAPARKKRDELRDHMAPLEAKLREMNVEIKKAQGEAGLYELDQEIARLERALGAKSMRAESLGAGVKA